MTVDSPSSSIQLTRFRIGDSAFAFDIMKVREVLNPVRVTAVPGAPQFVEGLLELRGEYLPVVDLRLRLGGGQEGDSKIVIAEARGRRVGFVVDQVFDVFRVLESEIRPLDELAQSAAFSGVLRTEAGPVMILDPDGLLSEMEVSALDALPAPPPS